MHIVEYQTRDMGREAEREFDHLHDALRFADSVIEDGGSACVYATEMVGYLPPHLCEVYVLEA